jgi:hypothetical protein
MGVSCSACHETYSVRYVARGSAFEPRPCRHEDPRREPCECGFGALRCAWCERPLREGAFMLEGRAPLRSVHRRPH